MAKKKDKCEVPQRGDIFTCAECGMKFIIIKDCCCDPNDKECLPCFKCCGKEMVKECD